MKRTPAPTLDPKAIRDSLQEQFLAVIEFGLEVDACIDLLPDGPVKLRLAEGLEKLAMIIFPEDRLAQAAPALLAACKAAIEWSKMGPMDFPAETLLAAIAEAEGDDGCDQEN